MNATPPTPRPVPTTFDLWERQGRPVAPFQDLHRVWPTSPYGRARGEQAPSAIQVSDHAKRKKGKR